MTDKTFDWTHVATAAKAWMKEHETAPKYLLLPALTNDEIMELAEEIYNVPVRRVIVEVPRFADELPKDDHSAILNGPLFTPPILTPPRGSIFAREQLIRLAEAGKLTEADIRAMSMDDYAAVRHILMGQVAQAMHQDGERTGNPFTSLKHM